MLGWAVTFLIIALIAAVLGFGGIAAASAGIAKILFFVFLVMCVLFLFLVGVAEEFRNTRKGSALFHRAYQRHVDWSFAVTPLKRRVRPLVQARGLSF